MRRPPRARPSPRRSFSRTGAQVRPLQYLKWGLECGQWYCGILRVPMAWAIDWLLGPLRTTHAGKEAALWGPLSGRSYQWPPCPARRPATGAGDVMKTNIAFPPITGDARAWRRRASSRPLRPRLQARAAVVEWKPKKIFRGKPTDEVPRCTWPRSAMYATTSKPISFDR
jgi:hypothetical protein